MSHNLILGESEESKRRIITVLTAYQKEYLKDDKDGTLSKFKPSINLFFLILLSHIYVEEFLMRCLGKWVIRMNMVWRKAL